MLDDSTPAQEALDEIKIKLHKLMHYDGNDMADEFRRMFNESPPNLIEDIFSQLDNPMNRLKEISDLVNTLI